MEKNKVLIIRFSSFGDIVQCSSVVELIRQRLSNDVSKNEIHWATRADFGFLVKLNSEVDQVWAFEKKLGLKGLFKFALLLRSENFTHVYWMALPPVIGGWCCICIPKFQRGKVGKLLLSWELFLLPRWRTVVCVRGIRWA